MKTFYALTYAKNAAAGVLFDGYQGNIYIAQAQYDYAIDALLHEGENLSVVQPRPYGGNR